MIKSFIENKNYRAHDSISLYTLRAIDCEKAIVLDIEPASSAYSVDPFYIGCIMDISEFDEILEETDFYSDISLCYTPEKLELLGI